jgi:hypothetical protein
MSTTPEDPFTSPPNPDAAGSPAAAPTPPPPPPPPTPQPGIIGTPPPGVIASSPGVIADAGVPPVGAPTGYVPPKPTGLSWAAIIATGIVVLLGVIGALMAPATVEQLKEQFQDLDNSQTNLGSTLFSAVTGLFAVAAFVFLALWMTKIRANLSAIGIKAGGPPAVEWWGWFVPIAWFVLPLLGMRAITRRSVGFLLLAGWWIPYCLYWIASGIAQTTVYTAIDWGTGELTDPDALDAMVPASWAAAVLLFLSWLFLVLIIVRTTDRHLKTA